MTETELSQQQIWGKFSANGDPNRILFFSADCRLRSKQAMHDMDQTAHGPGYF
jgi:hypothetical protein